MSLDFTPMSPRLSLPTARNDWDDVMGIEFGELMDRLNAAGSFRLKAHEDPGYRVEFHGPDENGKDLVAFTLRFNYYDNPEDVLIYGLNVAAPGNGIGSQLLVRMADAFDGTRAKRLKFAAGEMGARFWFRHGATLAAAPRRSDATLYYMHLDSLRGFSAGFAHWALHDRMFMRELTASSDPVLMQYAACRDDLTLVNMPRASAIELPKYLYDRVYLEKMTLELHDPEVRALLNAKARRTERYRSLALEERAP